MGKIIRHNREIRNDNMVIIIIVIIKHLSINIAY